MRLASQPRARAPDSPRTAARVFPRACGDRGGEAHCDAPQVSNVPRDKSFTLARCGHGDDGGGGLVVLQCPRHKRLAAAVVIAKTGGTQTIG